MLELRKQGLYCEAGDFYIDPMGAVDRAVITHAHSDHARRGAKLYYAVKSGVGLLRTRLGAKIAVSSHAYGEPFSLGPVRVSFHPAGHILGSAQVRLELGGEVWVASGDYKRDPDPTCEPFEPVRCDVFVTEATFGTPSYRWDKGADLGRQILEWWQANREEGYSSVVCAYSLGKTQRVLGVLAGRIDRAVYLDPNATALTDCYRAEGVPLADYKCLGRLHGDDPTRVLRGELVVAPGSFLRGELVALLGNKYRTAFASGWMATGGGYGHSSGYDHGFTMSDHADWDDLLRTVRETGARRVYVQHRGTGALVRKLREEGFEAFSDAALAPLEKKNSGSELRSGDKDKDKPAQLALF